MSFGFGAMMGMLVGMVLVHQVLATDVADHLREYATFKAMGYRHRCRFARPGALAAPRNLSGGRM